MRSRSIIESGYWAGRPLDAHKQDLRFLFEQNQIEIRDCWGFNVAFKFTNSLFFIAYMIKIE